MALADVPFLGAYEEQKRRNRQVEDDDLKSASGALGLMAAFEKRKQEAALRNALVASGGDVEKAIQASIASGNVNAAHQLAPLAKLASERREREETRKGLAALLSPEPQTNPMAPGPGASVMSGSGQVTPAQTPAPNATQARLAHLNKLELQYANNPTVLKMIETEKGKIAASSEKAPQRRERVAGEELLQEEFVGGKWQEIGRGPRFARQVAPVVPPNVVGEQGTKPPVGYRWKEGKVGGELEPIPGGPATRTPPEKALPTTAAQKLFENQQNLRRAEMALALIEGKDVGEMKGDPDATGWKGFLPDAWLQRMDPKGTDARAAIADLGSLVIHERSGAAVTAAEFPRLQPFIPKINDDPDTVKRKLKRFAQVYKDIASETANFYRESGYKVPDLVPATAAPTQAPTPSPAPAKFVEGKEYVDGKGNRAVFRGGKFVPVK